MNMTDHFNRLAITSPSKSSKPAVQKVMEMNDAETNDAKRLPSVADAAAAHDRLTKTIAEMQQQLETERAQRVQAEHQRAAALEQAASHDRLAKSFTDLQQRLEEERAQRARDDQQRARDDQQRARDDQQRAALEIALGAMQDELAMERATRAGVERAGVGLEASLTATRQELAEAQVARADLQREVADLVRAAGERGPGERTAALDALAPDDNATIEFGSATGDVTGLSRVTDVSSSSAASENTQLEAPQGRIEQLEAAAARSALAYEALRADRELIKHALMVEWGKKEVGEIEGSNGQRKIGYRYTAKCIRG